MNKLPSDPMMMNIRLFTILPHTLPKYHDNNDINDNIDNNNNDNKDNKDNMIIIISCLRGFMSTYPILFN